MRDMLNNLNKNLKKIIMLTPQSFSLISSKFVVYFGLAIYWTVIIAGTILQIN